MENDLEEEWKNIIGVKLKYKLKILFKLAAGIGFTYRPALFLTDVDIAFLSQVGTCCFWPLLQVGTSQTRNMAVLIFHLGELNKAFFICWGLSKQACVLLPD